MLREVPVRFDRRRRNVDRWDQRPVRGKQIRHRGRGRGFSQQASRVAQALRTGIAGIVRKAPCRQSPQGPAPRRGSVAGVVAGAKRLRPRKTVCAGHRNAIPASADEARARCARSASRRASRRNPDARNRQSVRSRLHPRRGRHDLARAAAESARMAPAAGARARRYHACGDQDLYSFESPARRPPRASPPTAAVTTNAFGLPQLDPLLALGSLSAVVAALDRWQLLDPGMIAATDTAAPTGAARTEATVVPFNRIPWIRAAVADRVTNPTDKITIDVIALLFDYIFRDPSIPESLRRLFGRLQVPILKAALLDRTFFSDKKHAARRLLDHLAGAAIGATSDEGYRAGLELVAAGVIEEVCRDFKVDVAIFDGADAKLQEFIDAEQRKAAALLDRDVAAALVAEESEADRTHVRALIRDKLAGITVPFEVRGFAETIWADYLTQVRQREGAQSDAWRDGVKILDDLLWSITAKERNAQKTRLAKMVPALIRGLRSGGAAVQVREDRLQPFLEAVYKLHIAAIRPQAERAAAADGAPEQAAESVAAIVPTVTRIVNVHDFVAEMVVGTWLAFDHEGKTINARLSWVSPMRTKYIFATRSRGRALALSPEELAWQLRDGTTRLMVEPVPLFDRAVSSALDELAARKPGAAAAA